MNTNPNAKTVLCYGDCNVYGYKPITGDRYQANIRWTGVLQNILGKRYEIIEEGLPRRNSGFEDEYYIGINGLTYLVPCILSHNPLDWIILWIGTRDHCDRLKMEPSVTANNMRVLVDTCKKYALNNKKTETKILLISPPIVTENCRKSSNRYLTAIKKSKYMAALYKAISEEKNIFFLDSAKITSTSTRDGMHLTPGGNRKIATAISDYIKNR